jgi:photosystem II stability/assembly factor-like uncharacterized protein
MQTIMAKLSSKPLLKYRLISFFFLFFFTILMMQSAVAQPRNKELDSLLIGKTRFDQIIPIVHQYYKTHKVETGLEKENDYQQWLRWEKWMATHLDSAGEFTNIAEKTTNAVNELNQRYGNVQPPTAAYRVETESPNATNSASGFWSPLGPYTNTVLANGLEGIGRMDRIAFHPTDPNTIFVGSPGGGLWKTTDAGTNWNCITNNLPLIAISGIAVNYNNPNIIYILTGDGDSHRPGYFVTNAGYSANCDGVYKTTDGGITWYKTGVLNAGTGWFGRKLAMDPVNPNVLLAATSVGLYKTSDGGTSWIQVRTGEHFDVIYKPGSSTVVYASVSSGIRYSTSSGNVGTWFNSTLDISPIYSGRVDLAVSPANSNYVYALFGPGWCNQTGNSCNGTGYFFGGIYRSTNSGVNFTRRSNTPNILGGATNGQDGGDQSDYDMGITVNPSNAEYIATCGMTVWNSVGNTGGTSMTYSTTYGNGTYYIHPDCHAVSYNPLNNYLYAATDGGFFRSIDNGINWISLTSGLATTQIYHMKGFDSNSDGLAEGPNLVIGCQDNGMKYRSAFGTTWNHFQCCDGFYSSFSPATVNTIWYSTNASTCFTTNGGVSSSCPLGVDFFPTVVIDPFNANNIYVGYSDTLYKSTNAGGSFSKIGNVRVEDELVVCPSNNARLYGIAGGYASARRSDNFGLAGSWTTISGTAGWPGGLPVTDIKPRPVSSLEVYACFGGYSAGNKVVRSTNGGASWTNYSGALPNVPFHSLAIATDGSVYAGSDIGVFYRAAGGADWQPFYNGLPRVPITDIVLTDFGNIYASTFGRGVWFSDVYSSCIPVISVSGSLNGANYYEASQYASVTSTTNGGDGTQLFVKAGDSVVMRPGFEVKSGSYYKAYIGPCGTGIPVLRSHADSLRNAAKEADFNKMEEQINGINKDGYLEIVLKDFGVLKVEMKFGNGATTILENKLYPPGVYWLPFKANNSSDAKFSVDFKGNALNQKTN